MTYRQQQSLMLLRLILLRLNLLRLSPLPPGQPQPNNQLPNQSQPQQSAAQLRQPNPCSGLQIKLAASPACYWQEPV